MSLIFVGLQLRQANKLARSAAIREQIAAMGRVSQVFAEDAGLADIWAQARAGRDLTPAEQVQLISSLTFIERIQEGLYWMHLEGQIDANCGRLIAVRRVRRRKSPRSRPSGRRSSTTFRPAARHMTLHDLNAIALKLGA